MQADIAGYSMQRQSKQQPGADALRQSGASAAPSGLKRWSQSAGAGRAGHHPKAAEPALPGLQAPGRLERRAILALWRHEHLRHGQASGPPPRPPKKISRTHQSSSAVRLTDVLPAARGRDASAEVQPVLPPGATRPELCDHQWCGPMALRLLPPCPHRLTCCCADIFRLNYS